MSSEKESSDDQPSMAKIYMKLEKLTNDIESMKHDIESMKTDIKSDIHLMTSNQIVMMDGLNVLIETQRMLLAGMDRASVVMGNTIQGQNLLLEAARYQNDEMRSHTKARQNLHLTSVHLVDTCVNQEKELERIVILEQQGDLLSHSLPAFYGC
jgi:3-phosphoglycerate kinase